MTLLQSYDQTIWWKETTSFVLFRTDLPAATIASDIKDAINPRTDIVVLGSTHYKTMLVIGASEDEDIYKLVDFAKKA